MFNRPGLDNSQFGSKKDRNFISWQEKESGLEQGEFANGKSDGKVVSLSVEGKWLQFGWYKDDRCHGDFMQIDGQTGERVIGTGLNGKPIGMKTTY